MRVADLSADLVRRLAVPGPRYTSYPPANVWGPGEPAAYAAALGRLGPADQGVSVYVHVPFCRVRCWYCGLNVSGTRSRAKIARYVDAVGAEAAHVQEIAGGGLRAVEVAWGGGTPTSLEPAEIERLAGLVARAIPPAPGARMSVEVDPRVTTREKLEALARAGFRRMSIGVQDLDPSVQAAAGRVQDEETSRRCLEMGRAAGFEGANVDLMYGLPLQRPDQLQDTVRRVLAWSPTRVTLFGYAHLPERFANQRNIDASELPGPLERLDLLLAAAETLESSGYRWLGLDHFVREDDELWIAYQAGQLGRTFMGYVPGRPGPMIALGASSIGEVAGEFVQNEREADAYVARITSDRLATVRGWRKTPDDELRADIIERLMCQLEVDLAEVSARHKVSPDLFARELASLAPLAAEGIVTIDAPRVRVTPLGRLFLRNVCMAFDAHRETPAGTSPVRLHASTV